MLYVRRAASGGGILGGDLGCICICRATQLREGLVPRGKQPQEVRAVVLAREGQFCVAVMNGVSAREKRVCAAHREPVNLFHCYVCNQWGKLTVQTELRTP